MEPKSSLRPTTLEIAGSKLFRDLCKAAADPPDHRLIPKLQNMVANSVLCLQRVSYVSLFVCIIYIRVASHISFHLHVANNQLVSKLQLANGFISHLKLIYLHICSFLHINNNYQFHLEDFFSIYSFTFCTCTLQCVHPFQLVHVQYIHVCGCVCGTGLRLP